MYTHNVLDKYNFYTFRTYCLYHDLSVIISVELCISVLLSAYIVYYVYSCFLFSFSVDEYVLVLEFYQIITPDVEHRFCLLYFNVFAFCSWNLTSLLLTL